jgi:hypothetical protein
VATPPRGRVGSWAPALDEKGKGIMTRDEAKTFLEQHLEPVCTHLFPAGKRSAAPSPKQLNAIERFGINPTSIRSRGHASALLDKLCKRSRFSLATPAQLRWLVKLQHPAPTLVSFDEASAFLSEKFSRRGVNTYA